MTTTLSREELIDNWPNCGHKCLSWREKYWCCKSADCSGNNGYYQNGEIEDLGMDLIEQCRLVDGGFLSGSGCTIPVKLRSFKCLSAWPCETMQKGK